MTERRLLLLGVLLLMLLAIATAWVLGDDLTASAHTEVDLPAPGAHARGV